MTNWFSNRFALVVVGVLIASLASVYVAACPFCSAINATFSEQIKGNDIVVIATLLEIPEPVDDPDQEIPKSLFEISDVIKGSETVRTGMKFRSLLVGRYDLGEKFLVMGVDPPNVSWSTPMNASAKVVKYLQTIQTLPESGPDRLAFFQKYFEDEEPVLAFDAYDEFAQASYEDVIALKDRMDREQLLAWIKDSDTATNRRRLYFTMLGVCGKESDIELLEDYIKSGDRKKQAGLDALVACYLKLKGKDGLPLIVETFLKDTDVEYVDTLSAVSALRFHGTEVDFIPQKSIVKAVRTVLDRPNIADMVIPDLARWEDWSVMEKLVRMFKEADEETSWLRVPIASYLRACPLPEAKKHIEELQKIDPDAIKRADFFLDFEDDDEEEESDDDSESDDGSDNSDQDQKSKTSESENDKSSSDEKIVSEVYVAHRVPLRETSESQQPVTLNNSMDHSVANESIETLPENMEKGLAAKKSPVVTPPVAMATILPVPMWQIILIPLGSSICIFVLLWSVISGWFDRLIY